jgi:hypothetical protein
MKNVATMLVVALLAAVGVSLFSTTIEAGSNVCWHRSDCGPRELCVADDEASSTGRCQHLRVLP